MVHYKGEVRISTVLTREGQPIKTMTFEEAERELKEGLGAEADASMKDPRTQLRTSFHSVGYDTASGAISRGAPFRAYFTIEEGGDSLTVRSDPFMKDQEGGLSATVGKGVVSGVVSFLAKREKELRVEALGVLAEEEGNAAGARASGIRLKGDELESLIRMLRP